MSSTRHLPLFFVSAPVPLRLAGCTRRTGLSHLSLLARGPSPRVSYSFPDVSSKPLHLQDDYPTHPRIFKEFLDRWGRMSISQFDQSQSEDYVVDYGSCGKKTPSLHGCESLSIRFQSMLTMDCWRIDCFMFTSDPWCGLSVYPLLCLTVRDFLPSSPFKDMN